MDAIPATMAITRPTAKKVKWAFRYKDEETEEWGEWELRRTARSTRGFITPAAGAWRSSGPLRYPNQEKKETDTAREASGFSL